MIGRGTNLSIFGLGPWTIIGYIIANSNMNMIPFERSIFRNQKITRNSSYLE